MFPEAAEGGATPQPSEGRLGVELADERKLGRHIQIAHTTIKGEHQLSEYVSRLNLNECVEILLASPIDLPALASHSRVCRVEADEKRGFEEMIRTWTVHVLSGLEAG